jgi:hypothetical protein
MLIGLLLGRVTEIGAVIISEFEILGVTGNEIEIRVSKATNLCYIHSNIRRQERSRRYLFDSSIGIGSSVFGASFNDGM